MNRSINYRV